MRKTFKIAAGLTISVLLLAMIGCEQGNNGGPVFLDPSSGNNSGSNRPNPSTSPAVNEHLAAQAGLEKLTYHIGPIDLPAGTSADKLLAQPLSMNFQLTAPMWVIGFEPKVVNAQGDELPATLLHHAKLLNAHEENPLCPNSGKGNPFAVSSSLLTNVSLPAGYGYPLLPSDPVEAEVVLHNPGQESYIDVFFEITLLAKPMNEFVALKDVAAMLVDFEPCANQPLEVEPESLREESATYSIEEGGNLIFAHGVLQDYGVAVQLKKKDEINPFWRADAKLDSEHQILDLLDNPFADPAGIPFAKGDNITVGAIYDNFSKSWLHAASAGAMIYLARDE